MQNNIAQINASLDSRIAKVNGRYETGAITAKRRDENLAEIAGHRSYFTGAGAIATADEFGLDLGKLTGLLADKSLMKFRGLVKSLETGTDKLDGYLRPVFVNAVLFGRKSVTFDNTTQQAVLSMRVDAERSALIKDRQHYAPSTSGSQTSQCRRLLIDSGLATGSDDEKHFVLNAEHPAVKRLIEVLSKKKK